MKPALSTESKIFADLSGGRNGVDSPVSSSFPDDQCVEVMNMDFFTGGLGRKRPGSYDVIANSTSHGFTKDIYTLIRHVPTGDETAGQIWAVENKFPNTPAYLPAGTVWTPIGSADGIIQDHIEQVNGVSFNGQLFYLSNTPSDRLRVYDSALNKIRVVGINAPSVTSGFSLSVANQGGGAYPAVLRYYRFRYIRRDGSGNLMLVGEPGPSDATISITPSGAGASVRLTISASVFENATHWRVEASTDNINFYQLTEVAIGTSTYDDSALTATYSNNTISEVSGTYTLIPSAKYGTTDGNRLILVANWEGGHGGSRVYVTPVLGTIYDGDTERLFQTATIKPYLDLNDKNGGDATGVGCINGVIYVFKYHQIWRLTPTGNLDVPYSARRISGTVGAISHKSIALGEDAIGNACLYFMSHNGPYRVGLNGVEYLGRDIEDVTLTSEGLPNINTVATGVVSHSVFHEDLGQWWLWFATGVNNSPNELFILDINRAVRKDVFGVRGGWTRFSGEVATATCSCMGNYKLAATGSLKPWIGIPGGGSPVIAICDRGDLQTDRGTNFQAYLKTKSLGDPAQFGNLYDSREAVIVVSHHTGAGVTLKLTLDRDMGQETLGYNLTLAGADVDKTLIKKFDSAQIAGAAVLQATIGDSAAAATQWQIDLMKFELSVGGEV